MFRCLKSQYSDFIYDRTLVLKLGPWQLSHFRLLFLKYRIVISNLHLCYYTEHTQGLAVQYHPCVRNGHPWFCKGWSEGFTLTTNLTLNSVSVIWHGIDFYKIHSHYQLYNINVDCWYIITFLKYICLTIRLS